MPSLKDRATKVKLREKWSKCATDDKTQQAVFSTDQKEENEKVSKNIESNRIRQT